MDGLAAKSGQRCDACYFRGDASALNLTPEGQQLCRSCHGKYLSAKATHRARNAEEYRRCSSCHNVVRPVVEMMQDEDGGESIFAALRVYPCRCGHRFSTLAGAAIVANLAFLAIGCYFAGRGFAHDDPEGLVCGLVFAVPAVGGLLWDAWQRHHHPRMLGSGT